MKVIGLLGGMSWESTVTYYQIINREVKSALGGLHSAKCVLYSVDFAEIEQYQSNGEWDEAAKLLTKAAKSLENAGADFIMICTNTMHKVADEIQISINIPILHIAEATSKAIKETGLSKIALLGTKYTMEQDFYSSKMIENGIQVLIPKEEDRNLINDIIYKELCLGEVSENSRSKFKQIISQLVREGAEGVVLGCTEIGLLIKKEDSLVPIFDTTDIHAKEGVKIALSN